MHHICQCYTAKHNLPIDNRSLQEVIVSLQPVYTLTMLIEVFQIDTNKPIKDGVTFSYPMKTGLMKYCRGESKVTE